MTKKAMKERNELQRASFEKLGCFNPTTRVIPDKKKQANKSACRKGNLDY